MKWMFEEAYLKHNHESKKKTREQSVVFMYLQFNWPCWNFENEKWDILEKKEKSWRPTNTTSKTSLKKYKTTFSVSYYIFWRSNFMHMKVRTWRKNVIKQTNKQILIDSFAVILQFPKTNFTSKEIHLPSLFHIIFWWKTKIQNLEKTIIFLRSEQTIQMKNTCEVKYVFDYKVLL